MIDGQQMGCRDCGPPETHTDEQLSRAHDVIQAIGAHASNTMGDVHCNCRGWCDHWEQSSAAHLEAMVNACVPERMRFEMKWNNWTYRAR